MGIPADQLGAQEHVVMELREHWKRLLVPGLICAAALVGLLVVLAVAPDSGAFSWLDTLGWIAFLGVLAVFGLWPYLRWRGRTYTITNERLLTRRGVVRRHGRDIPLSRINDVAFEQGMFDRMSGAGTLKVSAASEEGTVVLHDVPNIHEVTRTLNALTRDAGSA
ncbi:PH domain-containing protein [Nocardioides mesophilus]|uniref:PH domain-containing protein n=1 Tax=Nocardioides mesophilus TaxID=433659 RepID=A0A7G9RB40_9ACTN|nr:PH domain-containing protein [Nocardioides mesophilus]QNN52815.1 PH domain-containing protein [Nocardioides mesophilus]